MLLPIAAMLAIPQQVAENPPVYAMPGEEAVDPYVADPANAGARAFSGDGMAMAFHGQDGIRRVVEGMLDRAHADPVIGEVFIGHDRVRLSRTLFEQFCFILNAGCEYSGRDMASSHKDLGLQQVDLNRLVELLQAAMKEEGIVFSAQNRFLSKLAPMRRDVVVR